MAAGRAAKSSRRTLTETERAIDHRARTSTGRRVLSVDSTLDGITPRETPTMDTHPSRVPELAAVVQRPIGSSALHQRCGA